MRILIINHYTGFPKMGMEFRPYYFALDNERYIYEDFFSEFWFRKVPAIIY